MAVSTVHSTPIHNNNFGSGDVTVSITAPTNGHLMIISVRWSGTTSIPTCSGYTLATSSATATHGIALLYRIASSDGTSVTVSRASNTGMDVSVFEFAGVCDGTGGYSYVGGSGSSSSGTSTSTTFSGLTANAGIQNGTEFAFIGFCVNNASTTAPNTSSSGWNNAAHNAFHASAWSNLYTSSPGSGSEVESWSPSRAYRYAYQNFFCANVPSAGSTTSMSGTYVVTGTVGAFNGQAITAAGFAYGSAINPTTQASGSGLSGTITATIPSQSTGVGFYVRQYTTNDMGTTYGTNKKFCLVGQASESVTADAMAKSKVIGQASETATATVTGRSKTVTVGQAVAETSTGQSIVPSKKGLTGQASEANTATLMGITQGSLGYSIAVDQAAETYSALAVTPRKSKLTGQALETATGMALALVGKMKLTGQALETFTATIMGRVKTRSTGQGLESYTAQTVALPAPPIVTIGETRLIGQNIGTSVAGFNFTPGYSVSSSLVNDGGDYDLHGVATNVSNSTFVKAHHGLTDGMEVAIGREWWAYSQLTGGYAWFSFYYVMNCTPTTFQLNNGFGSAITLTGSNETSLHVKIGRTRLLTNTSSVNLATGDNGVMWDGGNGYTFIALGDSFGAPGNPSLGVAATGSGTTPNKRYKNAIGRTTDTYDMLHSGVNWSWWKSSSGEIVEAMPAGITNAASNVPMGGCSIPWVGATSGYRQVMHVMGVNNFATSYWGVPSTSDPNTWDGVTGDSYCWVTNGSDLLFSDDDGATWWCKDAAHGNRQVSWDNSNGTYPNRNANFQQCALVNSGGYVYLYGTKNGRTGDIYLARVAHANVTDSTAYQYYTGDPTWASYSSNPDAATVLITAGTGELSVTYNSNYKCWMMIGWFGFNDGSDGTSGTTTVASASNGTDVSSFTGSQSLTHASTSLFGSSGTFQVATSNGWATISYTSKNSTHFLNCTLVSGSGTISTGGRIQAGVKTTPLSYIIHVSTAKKPEGPWSTWQDMYNQADFMHYPQYPYAAVNSDFGGSYGAFLFPKISHSRVYWNISWWNSYQTYLMETIIGIAPVKVDWADETTTGQSITPSKKRLIGQAQESYTANPVGYVYRRTFSDTMSITELCYDADTARDSVTDLVGITDAKSLIIQAIRSQADTSGITDTAIDALHATRTATDTVDLVDSATKIVTLARSSNDLAGLTDAQTLTVQAIRSKNDTAGITDTVTVTVTSVRTLSDNMGMTDNMTRVTALAPHIGDIVGVTDVRSQAAQLHYSFNDAISILSTPNSGGDTGESYLEQIEITDSIAKVTAAARATTEPLGVTDTLVKSLMAARAPNDMMGILDTCTYQVRSAIAPTPTDTLGIVDTSTRIVTHVRAINDTVGLTDTFTSPLTALRPQNDTTGITDARQIGTASTQHFVEAIGLTDTASRLTIQFRTINDSIGLVDTFTETLLERAQPTDTTQIVDTATRQVTHVRVLNDSIGITDTKDYVHFFPVNYTVTIQDNIGILDTRTKNLTKTLNDLLFMDTSMVGAQSFHRAFIESIGTLDQITWHGATRRTITEIVTVVDVATVEHQSPIARRIPDQAILLREPIQIVLVGELTQNIETVETIQHIEF